MDLSSLPISKETLPFIAGVWIVREIIGYLKKRNETESKTEKSYNELRYAILRLEDKMSAIEDTIFEMKIRATSSP